MSNKTDAMCPFCEIDLVSNGKGFICTECGYVEGRPQDPSDILRHVMDVLKTAQPGRSIQGLHTQLIQERGFKLHRLTLTGYLQCMERLGLVVSVPINPARLYMLPPVAKKILALKAQAAQSQNAREELMRMRRQAARGA